MIRNDTICALSTAPGAGALAVIRVTGPQALQVVQGLIRRDIRSIASHSSVFCRLFRGDVLLDEVMLAVFHGPKTFTGEDTVEISCHGSPYIQQQILAKLIASGARMADPGEFTQRAFMHGKMDLSQAEAVADLIASESEAAHRLAMQQMRGGFSDALNAVRERLIDFTGLMELELDFSEEDVEFADRTELLNLVREVQSSLRELADSFQYGNAIKNGVPVALVGPPNAGKSTLLNALLGEERAIVSPEAGTTRDTIEDTMQLDGITYRFIDTAGIRKTDGEVEKMGIERSWAKVDAAQIVIYLIDPTQWSTEHQEQFNAVRRRAHGHVIAVRNKVDINPSTTPLTQTAPEGIPPNGDFPTEAIPISAKTGIGLNELRKALKAHTIQAPQSHIVISNTRHYAALNAAVTALEQVETGLQSGLPGDLIALDLREALAQMGSITGAIDVDRDILGAIFGKFCIGK